MNTTKTNMTGHLAISQTVTALAPTPIAEPTLVANEPVSTSATSIRASSTTSTRVTSICSGRSLIKDRPSWTS